MASSKSICSAIYFLNLRGEVLVYRAYRDDIGCAPSRAWALSTQYPRGAEAGTPLPRL